MTYTRRNNPMCHVKLTGSTCVSVRQEGKPAARDVPEVCGLMAPANKPSKASSSDGQPAVAGTQFLTVAEVATLMRVSKMTVYRLVHSGELPAVRVGRSFRVHAKAVHDYLETSYFDAG
ncbi:DNA binding domain-containing protein, excisionase family [Rhodococcoides kyotonense]|uniref:DNA binding domain-containing protein, excisionase family n=2 Tax=Rhodococcoides kyotonense TaxID=398843 RepID=A0A239M861_9NOCA|nr:DNA binding domain-containing protein, excisionase family [Rhodococcus kyotonensis]